MLIVASSASAAGWQSLYNPDGSAWNEQQYQELVDTVIGTQTSSGTIVTDVVYVPTQGIWIDTQKWSNGAEVPRQTSIDYSGRTLKTWDGVIPRPTTPVEGEGVNVAHESKPLVDHVFVVYENIDETGKCQMSEGKKAAWYNMMAGVSAGKSLHYATEIEETDGRSCLSPVKAQIGTNGSWTNGVFQRVNVSDVPHIYSRAASIFPLFSSGHSVIHWGVSETDEKAYTAGARFFQY